MNRGHWGQMALITTVPILKCLTANRLFRLIRSTYGPDEAGQLWTIHACLFRRSWTAGTGLVSRKESSMHIPWWMGAVLIIRAKPIRTRKWDLRVNSGFFRGTA